MGGWLADALRVEMYSRAAQLDVCVCCCLHQLLERAFGHRARRLHACCAFARICAAHLRFATQLVG